MPVKKVKKKLPVKHKKKEKVKVYKTPARAVKNTFIQDSKPGPKGPSKYTPEIIDKICEYVKSGDYTLKELCSFVGISHETFFNWKEMHVEFSERLKAADEERLVTIKSIARKGLTLILGGYEYDEISERSALRGKGVNKKMEVVERTVIRKRVPPVPSSIFFALKNLDKEHFQDIQNQVLNAGGIVYIGGANNTESITIDED